MAWTLLYSAEEESKGTSGSTVGQSIRVESVSMAWLCACIHTGACTC